MNKLTKDIQKAARILEQGGLVGIPTETVYGLAANALDSDSVLKIFEAKKRPSFDPLIVHIADIEQLERFVTVPFELSRTLGMQIWPGPLTLIFPKKSIIPDIVTSGLDTVGIRIPSHPLTLELLKSLDFPLAAPSANPFGYISPTSPQHVLDQLENEVDLVLDGGESAVGVESTIIEVLGENRIKVLRWGGLDVDSLDRFQLEIEENTTSTSNPSAPGMLLSHYAPRKKLLIGNFDEIAASYPNQKLAFMPFQGMASSDTFPLTENGSIAEASQNLFKQLRILDNSAFDIIVAEYAPNQGLGKAINDRLKRASFPFLKGSND